MAVSVRDFYEKSVEDREVALFTAWLLVRAKNREEAQARIFQYHGADSSVIARAFRMLVEQYVRFMEPLYGGKPPFILFALTDKAFSEETTWASLESLGFEFKEPELV